MTTRHFVPNWLLLVTLLAAPASSDELRTLQHDDGTQEDRRSIAGAGHAVRFECPDEGEWFLKELSVHAARYGSPRPPRDDFQIVIANEDHTRRWTITKPYALFKRGQERWVRIRFKPVKIEGPFHVALFFHPTRTKGVFVGIDTDADPTHSATVVEDDSEQQATDLKGDWMIRAHVTRAYAGEADSLLGSAESASRRQAEGADRDREILGDARSLTLQHDDGSMDDHKNIQGALYTVAFETPRNVEGYLWEVEFFASQFGSGHDGETVNGDVYVLDENRKIITRTTFPYSRADQQKQWIRIPTLATRVQGKFYVSIDAHGTRTKGLYVGYQEGNEKQVASTDALQGDFVRSTSWSSKYDDLQWMIRVKMADRPIVYPPPGVE